MTATRTRHRDPPMEGLCSPLQAEYGAQAGGIAARLAMHFERGGEIPRAVDYWQQAGDNAARRNVHSEAIAALKKGLALLADPLRATKGLGSRTWATSTPGPIRCASRRGRRHSSLGPSGGSRSFI
jgi:hypothetical protein